MKFKDTLEISEQEAAGTKVFIIKDQVSGKFFRLKEKEFYIANLFDGQASCAAIAEKFQQKFDLAISAEQIEQFARQMAGMGLLVSLGEESVPLPPKHKRSLWGRLLFVKVKAFNPERLIEQTYTLARPFYSKTALMFYAALAVLAGILTIANFDDMRIQASHFFVPDIIPLVWVTIFIVTLIHEMSHTYSCRLGGGKVTDMGFLLLYFQPCFYSNVSDAYLFPEKKKRIAVTLAGIVSQVVVWALAVCVWRLTSTDNWVNSMAFIIIALSFIGVTFNFNPLLKLDGYYFLVDYWDIPNLRQKAFLFIRQRTLGLAEGEQRLEVSPREKRIFRYYGSASLLYSGLLIGYIVYRVGRFINTEIGGFGVALLVIAMLYFTFDAMQKGKIFQVLYNQRGAILRPGRLVIYGIIAVIILLILFVVKYPMRVTNECVTIPLEQIYLRTGTATGLAELIIERANEEKSLKQFKLSNQDYAIMTLLPALKIGDIVKRGDMIASIKSNVIETDKIDRVANLERQKKQLDLLEKGPQLEEITQTEDEITQAKTRLEKSTIDLNRAESLHAIGGISTDELEGKQTETRVLQSELDYLKNQLVLLKRGARPEQIDMAKAQVDQLEAKVRHSDSQMEQTRIESPFDGIVTMVNNGNMVIAIARIDTVRTRIYVPEKEISVVKPGNPVKMKVRAYPAITYEGTVIRIDPLVVDEGNRQGVILVTANIANHNGMLKPGMTGKAKINCGKWPIYRLILWRLVRYLRVEFWSWW